MRFIPLSLVLIITHCVSAYVFYRPFDRYIQTSNKFSRFRLSFYENETPADSSIVVTNLDQNTDEPESLFQRNQLKQSLLTLCASFDRGFAATPRIRRDVDDLIRQLESVNPMKSDAAEGIDGLSSNSIPLKGAWRMIWTTALDVLNLAASPTVLPSGIYQIIDPPIATNVIDFIPRAQSLFPVGFPSTVIRAQVKTRTSARDFNRVGLQFEAVQVQPVEVLGLKVDMVPPLKLDIPRINVKDLPGVDPKTAPGYFDIIYLDDEMLIIKQSAPGGYFVSLRVSNYDP